MTVVRCGAMGKVPVQFHIDVQSCGIPLATVRWEVLRRKLHEELARSLLARVWNPLVNRLLWALRPLVDPRFPVRSWCDVVCPQCFHGTAVWEEIRRAVVLAASTDVLETYQAEMWPTLRYRLAEAFTGSSPIEIVHAFSLIGLLTVDCDIPPFSLDAEGRPVELAQPAHLHLDFHFSCEQPLEVNLALGV